MRCHVPEAQDLISRGHGDAAGLRAADGASFLTLDGRNAVFSEAAQKIYALNDMAAYIWCRLEERQTPPAISSELARSGVEPRLATQYVEEAVLGWLKLGLLTVDCDRDPGISGVANAFSVRLGQLTITVQAASAPLAALLAALFGESVMPADWSGEIFRVIEADHLFHVFHNQRNVLCCAADELAPSIKAYITEQLVMRSLPDVAFHAACLVRGGRCVLISGAPGAGKTTLALQLVHAGFAYRADDIVMISPEGNVTGIPFSPALKPGAWSIVGGIYPELNDAPVHHRPDGQRVRYLQPARVAPDVRYPVGWIVFITRCSDGPADLQPLGRMDALGRLIDGCFASDGRLTAATCQAFKQTLANASSFELTYSNGTQARDVIVSLCDG